MSTRVAQPEDDQTYTFKNRVYSRFAVSNNVYCVPVDEVGEGRPGSHLQVILYQSETITLT
jgi:hypothetical protein